MISFANKHLNSIKLNRVYLHHDTGQTKRVLSVPRGFGLCVLSVVFPARVYLPVEHGK